MTTTKPTPDEVRAAIAKADWHGLLDLASRLGLDIWEVRNSCPDGYDSVRWVTDSLLRAVGVEPDPEPESVDLDSDPEVRVTALVMAWPVEHRTALASGRHSDERQPIVLVDEPMVAVSCGPTQGRALKALGCRYQRVRQLPDELAAMRCWVGRRTAQLRDWIAASDALVVPWKLGLAKPKESGRVNHNRPGERVEWAFRQDVTPTQRFVLVALAHGYRPKAGGCQYSLKALARRTGYNPATVKRALKALADKGIVRVEARSDGRVRRANKYLPLF